MNTYGSTVSRGARITDADVAKGAKSWEQAKAVDRARRAASPSGRLKALDAKKAAEKETPRPVEKGILRQGVARPLARVNPTRSLRRTVHAQNETVGKALNPMKLGQVASRGFKSGMGGWKDAKAAGKLAGGLQSAGRMGGQGAAWGMANPAKAGAIGGAGLTAGVMAGNGHPNKRPAFQPPFSQPYGGSPSFGKRYYDPENERRYRQGAGAAAAGIGGLELARRGVQGIRSDSKALRGLHPMAERHVGPAPAQIDPKTKKVRSEDELKHLARNRVKAEEHNANVKVVNGLRSSKSHLVRGRNAGKLGGGIALLGAAGALARNRHEERWD